MTDEGVKLPSGNHRTPWLAIVGGLAVLALGAYVVFQGPLGVSEPTSSAQAQQAGAKNVSLAEVTLPVEGMSCGACAARIKKTLKPMDGVAAVEVSLEQRNVRVRYAAGKLTPELLAKTISDLGYKASLPKTPAPEQEKTGPVNPAEATASEPGVKNATIPVSGMACESCVETIENLLNGIDGVKAARVSLKEKEARVEYVEGKVTPERLAGEITNQGFPAGSAAREEERK